MKEIIILVVLLTLIIFALVRLVFEVKETVKLVFTEHFKVLYAVSQVLSKLP